MCCYISVSEIINKQPGKKMQSLLFIFLLLTGGYLSSHIFNTGSGKWLFITIAITFLLNTALIFSFLYLQKHISFRNT